MNSVLPVKCTRSEFFFFFYFGRKPGLNNHFFSIIAQESSIQASVVHRAGQRFPHTRKSNVIKQHECNKTIKAANSNFFLPLVTSVGVKVCCELGEKRKRKKWEKCHTQVSYKHRKNSCYSHTHTHTLPVQI